MNIQKNLLKAIGFAVVTFSLVVNAGIGAAQTPAPGTGTAASAGATLAVPAGYSVIPPNDSNRADDQIVQLENLTVRGTSASVPGTIYASRNLGGSSCREYLDVNGTNGSRILPCPLAPDILYQISVQSDTILLLKNRARATIGDFAVGDHINIFGFMDPGTSGLQALIIRDLDKPAPAAGGYMQLNDLTVFSQPGPVAPPADFLAGRKGPEPCFSFGSTGVSKAIVFPCPLGDDISGSAGVSAGASAMDDPVIRVTSLYQLRQYYRIHVVAGAAVMNALRQPINLNDIQVGDHVNVYGRFIPATKSFEALIVRDLSVPRSKPVGGASLSVTVSNNRIVCIAAPCGQINGATVAVFSLDKNGPTGIMLYPYPIQTTVNGQAMFSGLNPGNYLVRVNAAGYASAEQNAVLQTGETARVNFSLSPQTGIGSPFISSLSPAEGPAGAAVTVHGSGFTGNNLVYFAGFPVSSSAVANDAGTLTFTVPQYYTWSCSSSPGTACPTVMRNIDPGKYPIYVVNENGISNSATFTVTAPDSFISGSR